MIKREPYFSKLIGLMDKKIIKVITGVRRCGKSTLMMMFKDYLKERGVSPSEIIYVNFEDLAFEDLTDRRRLYSYLTERLDDKKMHYILIDEIQNVPEFEKVINSLYLKDNVDLYITGSNSYMLSGELATLLTGRYIQIEMLPYGLDEFMAAQKITDVKEGYQLYLQSTSFPFGLELDNESQRNDYLRSLYNTIVLKDIVQRKKITDMMMLESVLRFLMDNVGSILSTTKISNTMTSHGRSVNVRTVESYISAFLESYLVYKVGRYDIKGKEYLKTLEKYYLVDLGLRKSMLGQMDSKDLGHLLENLVFLALKRQGYEVYIGKVGEQEIDFVAKKDGRQSYVQVALTLRDEKTRERELKPLLALQDKYPAYILTLDDDPDTQHEGIQILNALPFLMGKIKL